MKYSGALTFDHIDLAKPKGGAPDYNKLAMEEEKDLFFRDQKSFNCLACAFIFKKKNLAKGRLPNEVYSIFPRL